MGRTVKNLVFSILILIAWGVATASSGDLWSKFTSPDPRARTKVWWFHGETETTREGIDADLRAFRDKGVGGVVFYDQIHGNGDGAFESMSPQWWEMLKYAAVKARELGLSFEVAVSNGYVSGGPWITPELAMKKTVTLDTVVSVVGRVPVCIPSGRQMKDFHEIATVAFPDVDSLQPLTIFSDRVNISVADTIITFDAGQPHTHVCGISYDISPRGKGSTGSMNIPGRPAERYFGAKYTEYPPVGQLEYSRDGVNWIVACDLRPVESNIGHKSRRRTISFPHVEGRFFRLHIHDWDGGDPEYRRMFLEDVKLYRRDVIENVEVMTALRTEVTYPVSTGLNCGAISSDEIMDITGREQVTLPEGTWHIVRLGWMPTGARTKHGRPNLLGREADVMSAEAARVHYKNYFKVIYDTLAAVGCRPDGMVMDSHEAGIQNWTQGFDKRFTAVTGYDFVKLVPLFTGIIVDSRLDSDSRLREFRELIAETISSEYYATFEALCAADSVTYTSQSMLNIAADNILNRSNPSKPQGEFWAYQADGNYDCLDAASAAHLYGHPIASAEAFTDTPYTSTWDELLRIANIAYCRGINEFVVCASSAQPWLDRQYDDSASAHPYVFHRFHPRWDDSSRFWEYQARCATMLREGEPVVDLLVYIGEEPPLKTFTYKLPEIPSGFNFDVFTKDALLGHIHAEDREAVATSGMRYRAILVQDRTFIGREAELKLKELEQAGVPVIWCNRGDVPANELTLAGINPDIAICSNQRPDDCTLFFHRVTDDADIYFLYNHSDHPYSNPATLRGRHRQIELWDPVSVTRERAAVDADSRFLLTLEPHQALFVIATR